MPKPEPPVVPPVLAPPPPEAQAAIRARETAARAYWATDAASPPAPGSKPPWYQLMMFPYPSAAGLHVGNLYAFTGNDVLARWKRILGHQVFQPIGFDAFGIHSENYAWRAGRHPSEIIPENIAKFTDQLKRTGLMLDWSKSIDTTSPEYYKWTQWLFLELFKSGEAIQKDAPVNWCPDCATVIANEQVEPNGDCERHPGTPVETRVLKQWFMRTSAHAKEILDQVNTSDWSASTLTSQRQWLGETKGFEVPTRVNNVPLQIFTEDPASACHAEALYLAPEHSIFDLHPEAASWRAAAARLSVVARRKAASQPAAYQTGLTALHPLTNHPIPIVATDALLPTIWSGQRFGAPLFFAQDSLINRAAGLPIPVLSADRPISKSRALRLAEVLRLAGAKSCVKYRLSDWCISRQRYWGPPIPIIHCADCGAVPVPESDLPVLLPDIELANLLPDGSGQSPLARAPNWASCSCPNCQKPARRETDVSDTFLDSAWYFLRYPSATESNQPFNPQASDTWLPPDSYIGGNEHAVLHLLYARYITMMLHQAGHIPSSIPFKKFRAHGLITKDGFKMSKNRGNIVNPDQYIDTWGADVLRTYLMFIGPFTQGGDFRDAGIPGIYRFFERLRLAATEAQDGPGDPVVRQFMAKTHHLVSAHIEALEYNTAIAFLMEAINTLRHNNRPVFTGEVTPLVQLVAPFAPHLAEDLWRRVLGHDKSVFDSGPVQTDPLIDDTLNIDMPVQLNGRVIGHISVPKDAPAALVSAVLLASPIFQKHAGWSRLVYKPGQIVNIVSPVHKAPKR